MHTNRITSTRLYTLLKNKKGKESCPYVYLVPPQEEVWKTEDIALSILTIGNGGR